MDPETRDKLRESAQRRAISCPRCGSTGIRELSEPEKAARDDVFAELRYTYCPACGDTRRKKGK